MNKWAVYCDDEKYFFTTRAKARELAKKLNSHPANTNIRKFGPYKNVTGVARVYKLKVLWS